MPTTPWLPLIKKLQDGEDVKADTLKPIHTQLALRDQHLFEKIAEQDGKSALIAHDQPVAPDANLSLNDIVFMSENGLDKAFPLLASGTDSTVSLTNSSFVFGWVKSLNGDGSADVYLSGLININQPATSVLEAGDTEFRQGPYYLSRSTPGKLSRHPAGLAIFVGYAVDDGKFLLNPTTHEIYQYFLTYQFDLLDRPAGTPVLTGDTWTITGFNGEALGWAPVAGLPVSIVPTGAKFYYHIPADLDADTGLSSDERNEAAELRSVFPPNPVALSYLFVNGILQSRGEEGVFEVNQYGIFWMSDTDTEQPWASDLSVGWEPEDWDIEKGQEHLRPKMQFTFAKLNPFLREFIVTSIAPADDATAANIEFRNKALPTTIAEKGDLLLRFRPSLVVSNQLSGANAVTGVTFNNTTGAFSITRAPMVSSIEGDGVNISIVPKIVSGSPVPGQFIATKGSGELSGNVLSFEPENTDVIKRGLTYYLRFLNTSSPLQGVNGKFILSSDTPSADIRFRLYFFGESAIAGDNPNTNIGLQFKYQVLVAGSVVGTNTVDIDGLNVVLPAPYVPYTTQSVVPVDLVIPADIIASNAVIQFQLNRIPSTYTGNLGLISMYWLVG